MVNVALVGPLYNGLNKYIAKLAEVLTRRGYNVDRIGFHNSNFDLVSIKNSVKEIIEKQTGINMTLSTITMGCMMQSNLYLYFCHHVQQKSC
ncbi:hypothetical protein EI42_06352 [Thermosporothrix hazakensis]|jgi:hypothetical protein|uniref:Uncharacterized protein n=1 Tax=Thermosporothrix hazakensis TaxID=644383 RepID=A0A326TQ10_THEHA|nr:hypothetical protein [Thermosporothrix hazakensis]PZW18081.1 hypothetical protein EI42_06352 [Thermosporothrix hazakensis]GCE50682.1 hypothetical protein KTH_55510 [Thermosporothrix hazakensis]